MGELTLGIVLEPDTHSLAHCMLLRAYLIYSFLLLNDLFQWCTGPPSGRPVFGAFPPRWLCVLPYRAATHDIAEGER